MSTNYIYPYNLLHTYTHTLTHTHTQTLTHTYTHTHTHTILRPSRPAPRVQNDDMYRGSLRTSHLDDGPRSGPRPDSRPDSRSGSSRPVSRGDGQYGYAAERRQSDIYQVMCVGFWNAFGYLDMHKCMHVCLYV